jgi:hypothetical protein
VPSNHGLGSPRANVDVYGKPPSGWKGLFKRSSPDFVLGSNDAAASVEYPNELEFSMSANVGLQWREDVPDRCRFIRLAYFQENANARLFSRPDLHEYVRQNRELLLSAIYSLVLEWKRRGCPPGDVFTSFPSWGK